MIDTKTRILVVNSADADKSMWVDLPLINEEEFEDVLNKLGIEEIKDSFDLAFEGKLPKQYEIKEMETMCGELRDAYMRGEFENIFEISDAVEELEDLEPYQEDVFHAYYEVDDDFREALRCAQDDDCTLYGAENFSELAEEWADEGMVDQETLLYHVDWEGVGRDLFEFDDNYHETSYGVLYVN